MVVLVVAPDALQAVIVTHEVDVMVWTVLLLPTDEVESEMTSVQDGAAVFEQDLELLEPVDDLLELSD